jgi:cytochrome bd-type quinol oxidase subunit 2
MIAGHKTEGGELSMERNDAGWKGFTAILGYLLIILVITLFATFSFMNPASTSLISDARSAAQFLSVVVVGVALGFIVALGRGRGKR